MKQNLISFTINQYLFNFIRFCILCLTLTIPKNGLAQSFQLLTSANLYSNNFQVADISHCQDTNLVVTYQYSDGFRLDTISENGNFIGSSIFQESTTSRFILKGCKEFTPGKKLIYGLTDYPTPLSYNSVITLIDSTGAIIWSTYTQNASNGIAGYTDVFISPSNAIYAVGSGPASSVEEGVILSKFNSNGQQVFSKSFNPESRGGPSGSSCKLFCTSPNSLILIYNGYSQIGYNTTYFSKADTLGNILWTKVIYTDFDLASTSIVGNDTSIYITGEALRGPLGGTDIFLANINFNGNINWLKFYGSPNDESGYSISMTPDNNIIIGGSSNKFNVQQKAFCSLILDSDGNQEICKSRFVGQSQQYSNRILSLLPRDSANGYFALGIEAASYSAAGIYLEKNDPSYLSGCGETFFLFQSTSEIPSTIPVSINEQLLSSSASYTFIRTSSPNIFNTTLCNSGCQINSTFSIQNDSICNGDTLRLVANDSLGYQYSWFIDDILVSNLGAFNISLPPGKYKFKLVIMDSICSDSTIRFFTIRDTPIADFSVFRQYHLLSLTNTSQFSDLIHWQLSDNANSYSNFFKHDFQDTGYINIQLIASGQCGIDTANKIIYVNDSTDGNFNSTYYGYPNSLGEFLDIELCPDGGVIAVGQGLGSSSSTSKTSIVGDPVWANYATSGTVNNCIAKTYDLGFVCGGKAGSYISIMKYDSLGRNLWTKSTNGWINANVTGVAELANHDIIATGPLQAASTSFVICFSEFGTLKWFSEFSMNSSNGMLVKNNSVYVYGWSAGKPAVAKFTASGQLQWNNQYTMGNASNFKDASFLSPNKIIFISHDSPYLVLLTIDTLGNTLWAKKSNSFNGNGKVNISCIRKKIFITATMQNSLIYYTCQFDSSGNYLASSIVEWNGNYPSVYETISNYEGQLITLGGSFDSSHYFLSKRDLSISWPCLSQSAAPTINTETVTITAFGNWTFPQSLSLANAHTSYNITLRDSLFCSQFNCNVSPSFTFAYNGNAVDFTSTSTGPISSYLWDFGDGQFSSLASPSHIYWNPGTYSVCLHTNSAYCSDTICQNINVVITGNSLQNDQEFSAWPNPASEYISISVRDQTNYKIELLDATGQTLITKANISVSQTILNLPYPTGLYFICVTTDNGEVHTRKIMVKN